LLKHVLFWVAIGACIGLLSGSASAIFLLSLDWVSETRDAHLWLLALLPLAGFCIGYSYHRYGSDVEKGNNLILEGLYSPQPTLPLRMAPFVLFGTLITHLFGGSAGREGTDSS
jgi:H+/Cl- antiporter ClcA